MFQFTMDSCVSVVTLPLGAAESASLITRPFLAELELNSITKAYTYDRSLSAPITLSVKACCVLGKSFGFAEVSSNLDVFVFLI